MLEEKALDRRSFLKVSALAGGGMSLAIALPASAQGAKPVAAALTVYVAIAADNSITITAKNPEMGQGVTTSLPMMIAEELDCDWSQVKVVMAEASPAKYGAQMSVGSMATPMNYMPMRQAGAAARAMLVSAAAKLSGLPAGELTTKSGRVLHASSGKAWTYGELAAEAARQPVPAAASLTLKQPAQFGLIGKRQRGVESAKIVKGERLFGIDVDQPGQLYAIYETAPAHGGKLVKADIAAAKASPGVVAVFPVNGIGDAQVLIDGIAIVATNIWYAEKARGLLKPEWDLSASKDHTSARYDELAKAAITAAKGKEFRKDGDAAAALSSSAKRVAATYSYPFLAHATLEPQNCTAQMHPDGVLELWAPTQGPHWGMDLIAKHLGVPMDKQRVHIMRCGGGFGRRGSNDFMMQAAAIAKALPGKPIQLISSRADDLKRDYFRPGGWHAFEAGISADGKLDAFNCHFITYGSGGQPYSTARLNPAAFPAGLVGNLTYSQDVLDTVIPMGFLRAPGANGQAFAIQGFLDEVAEAAGKDLPTLLLELCASERTVGDAGGHGPAPVFRTTRARSVIERVLADSGWTGRPKQAGRGFGFAFYFAHQGYFAEVVDATVSDGAVKVNKVWVAGDVGSQIINPMGAEAQVRSSVIEGLQMALGQEMTFTDGAPDHRNFDGYSPARMSLTPDIAISFVRSDYPPTGLGEPALPPVIPALTNAIYAATGKRVRSLPVRLTA
ncbi:molybdopterin-dependent oxidoreductase [Novosphingobium sp. MW5]|nr:molybdopterin-dependent oxidoreductase [Novosphingobium sp. MW5]